jgi:hypothetical protein
MASFFVRGFWLSNVHGNTYPQFEHAPGGLGILTGFPLVKKTGELNEKGNVVEQLGQCLKNFKPQIVQNLLST